ncbi:MAG: hypothetical protein AAFX01_02875 [Cyanobacteria bacterium J06638_28]
MFATSSSAVRASEVETISPLDNGTYVFGESPEANQIGKTYIVLTTQSEEVVGAFYQPSSSFGCFRGHVDEDKLMLRVTDSYDQTQYPYALTLANNSQTASSNGSVSSLLPIGFYPLAEISDLDRRILETCQGVE